MIPKPITPEEKRKRAVAFIRVAREYHLQGAAEKLNWLLETNYFETNAVYFSEVELAELRSLRSTDLKAA